ncbi:hypothetical protein BA192_07900 [Yersinia pseudotuberculosis]|nr:hypothetical protein BA192_07900 [Yersinia pseudotuberculosis]
MLTVQVNSKYANDIYKYAFDAFALCAYSHSIETKHRCGRQELLAAPVRTTGCSLTKRGTKAEMLINPRDGFLPDSLGDQREIGFGMVNSWS